MQWLARLCVKRPVFATVLILFITVVGVVSYFQLGVDRFPNIDIPVVTVVTRLDGASPEQVETEISDKIEEAVNTISGLDELRSVSSEGVSQVFVSFLLDKDADVAAQEVRDRLSTVMPDLPKGIDAPIVTRMDPDAAPVLFVAVTADRPLREVTELADKRIRQLLENVSGVGQVTILGGQKREIQVALDPQRMRAVGVSAPDVQRALASQNVTAPGGSVDTGPRRLTLRLEGRIRSVQAIGDVIVRQQGEHSVLLRDVANVSDGEEEALTAARNDGKPAIVMSIRKQSGANSVAVVDAIRTRMTEIEPQLPGGYQLEVVRDNTETTRTSVNAVKEHLVLGALFAAIVVLLFLGHVRSTIIAAIAIPTSIIATFGGMWLMGFSLNVITLLALALAVGIVIDDAIVVLENIYRYIAEKGMKPVPAAVYATKEIGLAVLATTLSLLAVFVPIGFLGGIAGRFLSSFGLTMAFAIAVSLLVSFTLTPMLSSRWLHGATKSNGHGEGGARKPFLERVVDKFYGPIERAYMAALAWSMRHRWVIVVACAATLGSCIPLVQAVPKGFIPKNDEAQFEIVMRTPEGTSLAATDIVAERVARDVRTWTVVERTVVTMGDDEQRTPNQARIFVRLTDPSKRKESQDDIQDRVRREILPKLPKEYRVQVSQVAAFSGGGGRTNPVQYTLSGPDLVELTKHAQNALAALRKIPGAVDADSSLIVGNPEIVARVDRLKAADLGVDVSDIAAALQIMVGGLPASRYEEGGYQYDIRLRAAYDARSNVEALGSLTVPSAKLGVVPLLDVVRLETGTAPTEINRLNRQRQVSFFANVSPGYGAGQVGPEFEKAVRAMNLPPTYRLTATGQSREIGRTAVNFAVAFGLSFVFMYLILAAQFESWLHPITILISLPLTVPFALVSLLIFGQQLDVFTMLGILVLFGVVKKNSILQIDHTNQLRAKGHNRLDAILIGNRDRLRPILMTTLAFVAGMIPLVFSSGVGGGFNQATAGVVVGGQVLSLLLTLLATPVAYSLFDDLSPWLRRTLRLRTRPPEETGAEEVFGPEAAELPPREARARTSGRSAEVPS